MNFIKNTFLLKVWRAHTTMLKSELSQLISIEAAIPCVHQLGLIFTGRHSSVSCMRKSLVSFYKFYYKFHFLSSLLLTHSSSNWNWNLKLIHRVDAWVNSRFGIKDTYFYTNCLEVAYIEYMYQVYVIALVLIFLHHGDSVKKITLNVFTILIFLHK